ncbi:MAG: bifunctional metallophosphatase/5'-nucleotidase [Candidatus Rifleibacteriota bacterium]
MKKVFAALVIALHIFLFSGGIQAQPVEFTILHTSDIHAHLLEFETDPGKLLGGYARIKAYKDAVEKEGRQVLMLSSGDIFQGTFFYKFFQGIPDVIFMNRTGYSAMTLGNHEFDGGQAALAEAISYAKFPVLAANIKFKKLPELQSKLRPWTIVEIGGKEEPVKVAMIGLTVENLGQIVPGVFVKDLEVIRAEEALHRRIKEVKEAGAQVIIALAHLGWDRELEIFEKFPEIDGVLGGHTHLENSAVTEGPNGHRFIAESGEWGKGVTRLDVVYNPSAKRRFKVKAAALVTMDQNIAQDESIKAEAEGLWQQIQEKVNIPVGITTNYLNGDRTCIRTGETNLGNLVADCILDTVNAEIALINGGGIRSSIATGTITIGDCLNVLPFDNYLIKMEMSGATLIKIFDQVREAMIKETGFGGFLQVSRGLEVRYYKNMVQVTFNGIPVEPDHTYTIATNDFLSGGGNGLTAFMEAFQAESTGVLAADAFIKYIKEHKLISAHEEGRIKVDFKLPEPKSPEGVLKNIPDQFNSSKQR